jgi:hypothetical protein
MGAYFGTSALPSSGSNYSINAISNKLHGKQYGNNTSILSPTRNRHTHNVVYTFHPLNLKIKFMIIGLYPLAYSYTYCAVFCVLAIGKNKRKREERKMASMRWCVKYTIRIISIVASDNIKIYFGGLIEVLISHLNEIFRVFK